MGIRKFAKALRANTPKSELWFRGIAESLGFYFWTGKFFKYNWQDKFNIPLNGQMIPDLHNVRLKFAVEIDGSFHDSVKQKEKDLKKDQKYSRYGFEVFRVIAYNMNDIYACLDFIDAKRRKIMLPAKMERILRELERDAPLRWVGGGNSNPVSSLTRNGTITSLRKDKSEIKAAPSIIVRRKAARASQSSTGA